MISDSCPSRLKLEKWRYLAASFPHKSSPEVGRELSFFVDYVGFTIEDSGSAEFFQAGGALDAGDYDVVLFAWAGSGQIASGRNIYHTTGQQNYGKFSNEEVDAAWDTLAGSVDPAVHAEQVKVIEKGLWDNLFGIPLYAHPGVVAHSADVANVRDTATQSGAVWNAQQWVRAE